MGFPSLRYSLTTAPSSAASAADLATTVLAHMDLNARKVTEFSPERLKNLLDYKNTNTLQESLPFDLRLKIKDL